jgi:hypothetical protein
MRRLTTVLCVALLSGPAAAQVIGVPECEDGIDNDGDGLIDFPADPGCTSPTDNSEVNLPLDLKFSDLNISDLGFVLPDLLGAVPDLSEHDQATTVVPPGQNIGLVGSAGGGATVRPQSHGCGIDDARESASAVALILFALAAGLWWRTRPGARGA